MRFGIFSVLVFASVQLAAATADDFERGQIQQRISPVGQVRVEQPTPSGAVAPTAQAMPVAKKSPGEATYDQYCIVCHRDGVAGAPKFHNAADWEPRLSKKNIDALTVSATKGLNAMPPKGTCQECTEADLKAAIEYMVPSS